MNEVELVGVSHNYNGELALRDISVAFQKGKITAVIGRSGSGKSTLLKTINGLIRPDAGQVLVSGQPLDFKNIATQRRKIGYVVQGNGLFPHLLVEKNIYLPAVLNGEKNYATLYGLVRESLELTNLPESYAERYPSEVSGGEQQLVALARALVLDPPLLLMDEPFGSLDPITRRSINSTLLNLQKKYPRTIVIVTHDVTEAIRLADYLVVLEAGKVLQNDLKETVVQSPANSMVRNIIQAGLN